MGVFRKTTFAFRLQILQCAVLVTHSLLLLP